MIIVNTGNGKGKTTAAVGQIIRSLGQGFKVCLLQLFKGEQFYGEQKILTGLNDLDFFSFAKEHPHLVKSVSVKDTKINCCLAMDKVKELTVSPKKYDLIVLEEFNISLRDKFINERQFLALLKQLSRKSNIVITGRIAP
ncbi:MAG: cob(I)yrinic acid a,c-diamide adenosyltransferase [Endomicrobium sp.]|jgi:cob(I)alamin adenosyltransferase|nr:cob(I)yrinic acid a,c-diamide adenosyltransferase [Endomicrobium sp.]